MPTPIKYRQHRRPKIPADSLEYPKRFVNRLAVSIPSRLEQTLADIVIDPIKPIEEASDMLKAIRDSAERKQLLADAARIMSAHTSSPEAAADFVTDIGMLALTRNPRFAGTNIDEYAIAGLAAKNLPGQEKIVPYVPGKLLKEAEERFNERDRIRTEAKYGRPTGLQRFPSDVGATHGAVFGSGRTKRRADGVGGGPKLTQSKP